MPNPPPALIATGHRTGSCTTAATGHRGPDPRRRPGAPALRLLAPVLALALLLCAARPALGAADTAPAADPAALQRQARQVCAQPPTSGDPPVNPLGPDTPATRDARRQVPDLATAVLLRGTPALALAQACARLDAASANPAAPREAALDALLDIADAELALDPNASGPLLMDALAPLLQAGGASPGRAARWQLAAGQRAHEQGDTPAALAAFSQARTLLQAAGQGRSLRMAVALTGQAASWMVQRGADNLARADAALDEAEALLQALGLADSGWQGDILSMRSNIAYARDDLDGTLRFTRAEVELTQRLGPTDHPDLLHALTTQGSVLSQLARVDEAQAAFDHGLRIIAAHPQADPYAQHGIYSNLAVLLLQRGQPQQALPLAERAVQLSRQIWGDRSPRLLVPLVVRGQIEADLAQWAAARQSMAEAMAMARSQAASLGPVRVLRAADGLAGVQLALGEPDQAQAVLDEGLALAGGDTAAQGYWHGRVLRRRATLAMHGRDWASADRLLAQAQPLLAQVIGPRHPFVTNLVADRCVAQTEGHLPGTACAELQAAFDPQDPASPRQRFLAYAALALAETASPTADAPPGHLRRLHLQALAAALDASGPDPRWSAYDLLARHLRRSGQRADAVLMAKQAVADIEAMRADLRAQARPLERGFLVDKQAVYRRLADWLTEDGRIDEALQVLRLLKAEEFHDFVRGAGGGRALGGGELTLSAAEQQRLARWQLVPGTPLAAEGADKLSADEQAAQRTQLLAQQQTQAQRVRAWQALLGQGAAADGLAAASAAAAPVPAPAAPVPAHEVARAARHAASTSGPAVPPGTLLAWLYPGEQHLNLVLDSAAGRQVLRLPVAPDALARQIGQLLSDIGQRQPVDRTLAALYPLLGAPLLQAAERAHAQRLVLQVSGALRYLPFAALADGSPGRRSLGERLIISQQVLDDPARPLPAPAATARQVRAFGVTRALGGQPALPALAREICGIVNGPVLGLADGDAACPPGGGALPGQGWLNERFTRSQLGEAAAPAGAQRGPRGLLHLGTHFTLRPGRIGRSWLQLGDGQRLHLDELVQLDFSGQDLVTLSACETGLGGADAPADASPGMALAGGQEVEGLNLAVMRRGARAVLASLWRVDDDSTSVLMRALYAGLARHGDAARALRDAQATVRRSPGGRFDHPFYWAGFYLADRR